MTIGCVLCSFAWTGFLIPKEIVGGGVTGISTLIQLITGIPVSYSYLVINVTLLIVGSLVLGKGFGFKTIFCIVLTAVFLRVLPYIPWVTDIEDKLINAIIGGLLAGIGIAIIFTNGGSTGGTDIIALVISKYTDNTPGRIFMYCDLVIVGSVIFLPGKGLTDVVYGYVVMLALTYTIDMMLTGSKQSVQIMIFSQKYKELADMINNELDRGVTALNSVGWYSQQDSKVLVVIARKNQAQEIVKAIKERDSQVFISVCPVAGAYGRGFEEVKTGFKKRNENKLESNS